MKKTTTRWLKVIILFQMLLMPAVGRTQETNAFSLIKKLGEFNSLTEKERANVVRTNYSYSKQLRELLTSKFESGNDDEKSYAAYFLGEYRFPQAATTLSKNISWEDKVRPNTERGSEWFWDRYPAMEALIKIGSPAVPAVIRNLIESDDAKVRELSLKVLCHIDNDRDIVQLRLEKALKTETDSQKQARLQSALKALSDAKF